MRRESIIYFVYSELHWFFCIPDGTTLSYLGYECYLTDMYVNQLDNVCLCEEKYF